jgi:outer membrane protein OmpA-like peptidoglycan-associated protein
MKAKSICLVIFVLTTLGAFSQVLPFDTTGKRSTVPPQGADSLKWTSVIVHKSSDTVADHPGKRTEIKKPPLKTDKRWFLSPFLKLQAQDFGMLEKQRKGYLSDAETLSFTNKSNRSAALSAYKNLNGHFSASIDLGASMGHVTNKDSLVSTTKSKTYALGAATLYYNLLGNQFKLQPFLAAGINGLFSKGMFLSAPVGAGVKYSGKKIMITGEAAYGYSVSPNIANALMYTVGIYIPFRTKKQKAEDAEESRKKDTGIVTITNITNNYYFYNQDSVKKAQDSLLNEIHKKRLEEEDNEMDPDDPMKLPNASKHTVYFYYDQYALTSEAFGVIDGVITKMKANPKLFIHIKGHTDMSGSEQYNSPLSKKRSQMVFDYMNSRGISAERMILSGYGKKKPAIQNEDPNTAWMNRRCELVLFEKNKN